MTIGTYGTITTEQARKLAIETLGGIVLQKADPLLERKTRRASLTVAQLCDQYMKAAEKGLILGRRKNRPKKASTLEIDRGRIARHIKPLLGKKLVIDLTRADVTKFMRDVAAGRRCMNDDPDKTVGAVRETLGYSSWEAYVKAEFDISRQYSYRLIDQGRVIREIEEAAGQNVAHGRQIPELTPAAVDAILPGRPRRLWGRPAIARVLGVSEDNRGEEVCCDTLLPDVEGPRQCVVSTVQEEEASDH